MNTRLYNDLHYVEPVRLEIIKLHKVPVIYQIYEISVFKAWSHAKRINASGPDDQCPFGLGSSQYALEHTPVCDNTYFQCSLRYTAGKLFPRRQIFLFASTQSDISLVLDFEHEELARGSILVTIPQMELLSECFRTVSSFLLTFQKIEQININIIKFSIDSEAQGNKTKSS